LPFKNRVNLCIKFETIGTATLKINTGSGEKLLTILIGTQRFVQKLFLFYSITLEVWSSFNEKGKVKQTIEPTPAKKTVRKQGWWDELFK